MNIPPAIVYSCPAYVHWVRDADLVALVDEQRHCSQVLRGDEAMLWDWLALGYSYSVLLRQSAAVWEMPEQEAACILAESLARWHKLGWLAATPGGSNG
jgi:hypothetical protein